MQLGFVSAILGDQSFQQVVTTAERLGYDCVEMQCWPVGKAERRYAGVTHIDVVGSGDQELAEVRRYCADAGIAISALGYYPNPLSPDPDEASIAVQHLRHVIGAAAELEIGVVTTFIGRDWTQAVDANWPRLLETWGPMLELAQSMDIKIAIENCPMFFSEDEWPGGKNIATSPSIWRRLFADLNSMHLGLNYDPSHLVWQHMDAITPMREFADRIFHVHAKDVRVDHARLNDVGIMAHPSQFHTPKLPGLGDVDWGHFFSVLTEIQYRGPVCVEVEDRSYEGELQNRQLALQQSLTYLRNYVPTIR
ncbi:MAG: sugar phosphate isomerase/epimerase family protein [Planctomycetota bacterium]